MALLLIHGGAGRIGAPFREEYEAGLKAALDAGLRELTAASVSGGEAAALRAVLAAVAAMESNERAFNAGVGGALTEEGKVELDACVMVSASPPEARAGAVAGLTNTPNPIFVADRVRRETPHVLLIGAGAEALTANPVQNEALITPRSRQALERHLNASGGKGAGGQGSNTVGAVALDDDGVLAAATSTGGITGQLSGRVGDAPLPGLGTFADEVLAVSCTGKGEAFMVSATAATLAAEVAAGVELKEAVTRALARVEAADGNGGLIVVTAAGELAVGFNSQDMAYAYAAADAQEAMVASAPVVMVISP